MACLDRRHPLLRGGVLAEFPHWRCLKRNRILQRLFTGLYHHSVRLDLRAFCAGSVRAGSHPFCSVLRRSYRSRCNGPAGGRRYQVCPVDGFALCLSDRSFSNAAYRLSQHLRGGDCRSAVGCFSFSSARRIHRIGGSLRVPGTVLKHCRDRRVPVRSDGP